MTIKITHLDSVTANCGLQLYNRDFILPRVVFWRFGRHSKIHLHPCFLYSEKSWWDWPKGKATLLKPKTGCPDGWKEGFLRHKPDRDIEGSSPYHASPQWREDMAEHEFCTKDERDGYKKWPPGSYCIFRHGSYCPSGELNFEFNNNVK